MKKIIISSIVAFSLYSCSTTKPIIDYHTHSKTYIDDDGSTIKVTVKVDNNKCKRCKKENK